MVEVQPERDFSGQRFVRHIAAQAAWLSWRIAGFDAQDTGIGAATNGLAGIRVLRPAAPTASVRQMHDTEFCFFFMLAGSVTLQLDAASHPLVSDDSVTIPGGTAYALADPSSDLQLMEITLRAAFESTRLGPQQTTADTWRACGQGRIRVGNLA